MRILIVDDEPAIISTLQPALAAQRYSLHSAATAREELRVASSIDVELVLLDLGLSDADGVEIIAKLKSLSGATVLVLSARHFEAEKVRALDEGADDYINKPFGIEELLAQVRVAGCTRKLGHESLADEFRLDHSK
jgi:two-component system KDP operon response regulator KdpE